jgi:uncharacterized repeat protein (TIGR01451 family)
MFFNNINKTEKEYFMKRLLFLAVAITIIFSGGNVFAQGTPAGTSIVNTAYANYSLGGSPAATISDSDTITVSEVIRMTVTWEDGGNVQVTSPATGEVLQFQLTNTGNGSETFALATLDTVGGGDFDPSAGAVWMESGLQAGLQTTGVNADIQHNSGVNDPPLAADENLIVYVVSDIPGSLVDTNTGNVQITMTSATPGASTASLGDVLGTGEIVGVTNASYSFTGTYIVSSVTVTLSKVLTGTVDPFGGSAYVPGAILSYRITVNVAGTGTAEALVITDLLPGDTTYVSNSIQVDTVPHTDALDGDASDFGNTTANTVTVDFGDTPAPDSYDIDFKVTINN